MLSEPMYGMYTYTYIYIHTYIYIYICIERERERERERVMCQYMGFRLGFEGVGLGKCPNNGQSNGRRNGIRVFYGYEGA